MTFEVFCGIIGAANLGATLFAALVKIILDFFPFCPYNTFKKSGITSIVTEESTMAYTQAQEQKIRNAAPVDKAVAEKLASEFGVTVRSVISKTISMKVPYIKEVRKAASPKVRKVEVVRQIESALGVQINSLVNANAKDLATLLDAVS